MPDVQASTWPAKFEGKEYRVSPLDDNDIVEIDNWLQARFIERVRDSFSESMSRADKDHEISLAYERAAKLTWLSGDGAQMMATIDGISRVLWHQLRKHHAELTHADVRRMCTSPKNLTLAKELFHKLNVEGAVKKSTAPEVAGVG